MFGKGPMGLLRLDVSRTLFPYFEFCVVAGVSVNLCFCCIVCVFLVGTVVNHGNCDFRQIP